jgi:hypothetical protein
LDTNKDFKYFVGQVVKNNLNYVHKLEKQAEHRNVFSLFDEQLIKKASTEKLKEYGLSEDFVSQKFLNIVKKYMLGD